MTVSFGYDVRVPTEAGWNERVRAYDIATFELPRIPEDLATAFMVETPQIGEYGIVGQTAVLDRHRYLKHGPHLLHGLAAARPTPPDAPFAGYRAAPVHEMPLATAEQFERCARHVDWQKDFPWAWRPFEPSKTVRSQAGVNLRRSAKPALGTPANAVAAADGRRAAAAEAGIYVLSGKNVLRLAGEPVWAVSMSGPPVVVAACDHAAALSVGTPWMLHFPADRRAEAVLACADMHRCAVDQVAVVGRIEIAGPDPVRFQAGVFEMFRGLIEFVDETPLLVAAAASAEARTWFAIRAAVADLPDPKFMNFFCDPGQMSRAAGLWRSAVEFVRAVRRSGQVDDRWAEKAADLVGAIEKRVGLVPGGDVLLDGAWTLSRSDEDAIGALA